MKRSYFGAVVLFGILSAVSSSALPYLEGNLGLTGTFDSLERYDASASAWVGANMLTAERLNFTDVDPLTAGVQLMIGGSTGDFASENGLLATIASPFTFIPSTAYVPLWITTDGRFRFDLATITGTVRSSSFLFVEGTGFLTDATGDHSVTAGGWQFSSRDGFTFSANTVAVPEGGSTLVILGIGLITLAGFAFRRNNRVGCGR
jgi:hypothetical protein